MAGIKPLFNLSNWASVVPAVKETFSRFPLAMIAMLSATLIALLLIHEIEFADNIFLGRCLASMLYAVVALTSLKLFVDSEKVSKTQHTVAAITIMAVIVIFVWVVFSELTILTYILFSVAVILSLLFSPYINRPSSCASVWYFNYQTGAAVFFAGLAAIILGIGMSLILASIAYLFETKIPDAIYADIWVLSWGILFPIYVLSNISQEFDFEDDNCAFPKGVSFITNYILVPLMFAYMAILYAYFIKIIVQWELPRGNLGWMITTFGSIGITTKLLVYPIRSHGTRLLVLFDKYYYYALIVPVVLLAMAIGVRINDYGVTEQRYAVVLLGVWFSIITLLAIFKKDQFHIKYVPIILAALAFFSTFGPWGAVEVSIYSQTNRFESLLIKHKLLVDGQAVKARDELPFEDRKTLSSIADYLSKTENRQKRIRPWFESLNAQQEKNELTAYRWKGGRKFIELLGVSYTAHWQKNKAVNSFAYKNHFNPYKMLVDVSEFDYIGRGDFSFNLNINAEQEFVLQHKGSQKQITIKRREEIFVFETEPGEIAEFDLARLILELRQQNILQTAANALDNLTITQTSTNGRFKVRLLLERIYGKITKANRVDITSVSFILMLKFNAQQ